MSSPSTDLEVETLYKDFRPGYASACGLSPAVSDACLAFLVNRRAAESVRVARVKAASVFIRLIRTKCANRRKAQSHRSADVFRSSQP